MRAAALLPWQNSARAFGTAMRCRHRWLSFAAYITWVCCTATAMELMWRSGGGSDESLIGINGLSARVGSTHAVHARRSHHLATYLHQLTSPSSGPVFPQGSLLPRLAWLASELRSLCGAWEFNFHLGHMVLSLQYLEWPLAVLYACVRAVLVCSLCVCALPSFPIVDRLASHGFQFVWRECRMSVLCLWFDDAGRCSTLKRL